LFETSSCTCNNTNDCRFFVERLLHIVGIEIAVPKYVGMSHFLFGVYMLYYSLVFLVVAIVAGVFGMSGVSSTATNVAQILFIVGLIGFAVSLLFGGFRGQKRLL
jgi:uncharacterized membrane protein YtjA (UPF0391 family)